MDTDTWFFTGDKPKEEVMAIATLPRPFAVLLGGAPDPPEPDLSEEEEFALTVHALVGTCAHYWDEYAALGERHLDALYNFRLCRSILQRLVGQPLAAVLIAARSGTHGQ